MSGRCVWRSLRRALLALALLVAPTAPGHGQNLDRARMLYDRGVMLKAADLARGIGTADGYALAAQATLVAAIYQVQGKRDVALLRQAAADARAALAIDPDHLQALLRLALALGYIADADPVQAQLDGTANKGKALLDRALALAPDNAWPHGLLGIWHLRIVMHAGPILADSLYGATLEQGRAQCDEAARIAPEVPALRFGCAVSLLEVDPTRYQGEAVQTLGAVVRLPATDAAGQLVRAEARRRLDALEVQADDGLAGPKDDRD